MCLVTHVAGVPCFVGDTSDARYQSRHGVMLPQRENRSYVAHSAFSCPWTNSELVMVYWLIHVYGIFHSKRGN